MSSKNFRITTHTISGQHIREYPNSSACSEDILQIEVKQYTPLSNPTPKFGDITILAAHANGFPKELYEPLWDTLLQNASLKNLGIRGIWIADMANQGSSGILNESKLGREYHWFDHSRDLLRMVDHFRSSMPLPIIGIGHSLGAIQLIGLAQMHPRLLTNLILLDPPFSMVPSPNYIALSRATAFQKDIWSSRAEAETAVRENPLFAKWDKRVLKRQIELLVRETPTALYPNAQIGSVTKRTTKHQEFHSIFRPNFNGISKGEKLATVEERRTHPDADVEMVVDIPFYVSATRQAFRSLPMLRPGVLFIHGERSPSSTPNLRKVRLDACGVGPGGSGGVAIGRVKEVVLDSGHFFPFDMVDGTGKAVADYLVSEMEDWKRAEMARLKKWEILSARDKQVIGEKVLEKVKSMDKSTARKIREISSKI